MKMVELLAPAGDWGMLRAAVDAGADSVYLGIKGINMRAGAANFSLNEVGKAIDYCHKKKVKVYCTVNTIVFEQELDYVKNVLMKLKEAVVDAVICWDLSVIGLCEELEIPVHISTQASISNYAALKTLKRKFSMIENVVLARECSLENIRQIKKQIQEDDMGVKVETFIHGARCISESGRCFMSYELFQKSANRGECLQPCRREWKVVDKEEGHEMILNHNFILSAKDLCTLPLLPKLVDAGIDCFKIEGRNRGADYVHKVVSVYKEALDAVEAGEFNEKLVEILFSKLKEAYNKDFSLGFYIDYPHHERCDTYGNKSTTAKVLLGKVGNFYRRADVAEFKVESESFRRGDRLCFIGPTTGYKEIVAEEIHNDHGNIDKAEKGETISVKVGSLVRENDRIYLIRENLIRKKSTQ